MRIFRSDAANGVDNVINLSIPAGERMGQRDVREGVVGTVPADLKFIIGQLKVMKTYVQRGQPAYGSRPNTFSVVGANLLRGKGKPRNSSGRPRRGMGH